MKRAKLSDREERILRSVIECHIKTAKPVSSSAVVRNRSVPVSSATVRNVMRSLEEKGLILQPHTSAGRIPTDAGYRYYVDNVMEPRNLTEQERADLEGGFASLATGDLGAVVAGVSRMMSDFARQLAVTVAPSGEREVIEQVKLVSLETDRILAVATTRAGLTRSAVFELGREEVGGKLADAAALVTEWLSGTPVGDAERTVKSRLGAVPEPTRRVIAALLATSPRLFRLRGAERVHYEGARYILRHPEFSHNAAFIGEIFDDEEALADLVRGHAESGGVSVTIGGENPKKEMKHMSLVVGSYRIGGTFGQMGVIGPTRMRYGRLVGLVDYVSEILDELFSGRGRRTRRSPDKAADGDRG